MRPLYVIIILGVLLGAGFYYRDSLAQKVADLYPSQDIPPTPKLAYTSPTPTPAATPTPVPGGSPTPAPTATLVSIAQLGSGQPLPKSGPELDLGLMGAVSVLGGGGYYQWRLRRRLRRRLRDSLKGINIL